MKNDMTVTVWYQEVDGDCTRHTKSDFATLSDMKQYVASVAARGLWMTSVYKWSDDKGGDEERRAFRKLIPPHRIIRIDADFPMPSTPTGTAFSDDVQPLFEKSPI